jgi:hypothetical protein
MRRIPLPLPLSERSSAEATGLASAARVAATLSGEIAAADPDPALVVDLAERALRVPARLFDVPSPRRTAAVLADWRHTQRLLGRRLSPPVHAELLRIGGYLSFYLGLLALDASDDASARRFATLADQHAVHADDPLLIGTAAGLDVTIALAAHIPDAALRNARRMAGVGHPHLDGWAALFEAIAAGWLADADGAADALHRLRDHRPAAGGPYPGWPPLEAGWVSSAFANVTSVLRDPAGLGAADAILRTSELDSSEWAWGRATRAAVALTDDPDPDAEAWALGEITDLLDRWPSRLLAQWISDVVEGRPGRLDPADDPGSAGSGPAGADGRSAQARTSARNRSAASRRPRPARPRSGEPEGHQDQR